MKLIRLIVFVCSSIAALMIGNLVYSQSQLRPVVILKEWHGRVNSTNDYGPATYIDNIADLKMLWTKWVLKDPFPKINFKSELVLVCYAYASTATFKDPQVDDRGDLKPNIVVTPDIQPSLAYTICLIKRDGITSIGGKSIENKK